MGYRKAARMRRTQYVGGHYRTSSKGKTYWVNGHTRNDYGNDGCGGFLFVAVAIVGLLLVIICA